MLDWSKPLQTRNGYPATVLHEYYNGVQQMVVVSINRGPTCSIPDAKPVELIKVYDQRWGMDQTHADRPSMCPPSDWDLREVPPPDITLYAVITPDIPGNDGQVYGRQQRTDAPGLAFAGQVKIVVDGRTRKIKAATILPG